MALVINGTANAATCTGTYQLGPVTFNQPSVTPTGSFTATATIQNCTNQLQIVNGYWLARSVMPTGVPYIFCTGNDPFPLSTSPVRIFANGSSTVNVTFGLSNPGCAATAIHTMLVVNPPSGAQLISSADIPVVGGAPGCTATYVRDSEWTGGFSAQVTVTNKSSSTISHWSVSFGFPGDQQITSFWNAAIQQSGSAVFATNASYNGTIGAGGSTTFGFNGTWHSNDSNPGTLNCSAG